MNLDDAQRRKVAEWIGQGLKLSEIQNRLGTELGVRLTYMEVRLLVDDLKLTPKDAEPAKPVSGLIQPPGAATEAKPRAVAGATGKAAPKSPEPAQAPGQVSLSVDQIARPGAVVSGKVTFSDGQRAEWQFDQTGRLAMTAQQPGYRPTPADLQEFQLALENELSRMGF